MADSSDGQELVVENGLGMVLEEDGVTVINSPCLDASSIILTNASNTESINVSHYIIPQEVTVAGFEEVVEEDVGSSWDSITSSSPVTSLGQDSGIESDANPDVFFAFVDDTVSSMTFLTSVPCNDSGEIFVQKMYEFKDDLVLPQVEIKDEDIIGKDTLLNRLKGTTHVVKLVIKDDSDDDISETDENVIIKHEDILDGEFFDDFRKNNEIIEDTTASIAIDKKHKNHINSSIKNSQKQLMYHCTECDTNFTSHKSFKGHMEEHLIRLQNSCALCNREFNSKSDLQDHIKDHFAKSSAVSCEICKKEFVSRAILKRHKKQAHNINGIITSQSLKCDICQAIFSSKFSLKSHSASHNTRKPFTCKECGATFTQNGSLQVHLRRHRGEKPFKCSVCGNNFTRAHSLKVHMKTHTGEKPYSCEYCGACFVTSSHLTVHKRTHTGERPYSCSSCGATFITTSHLNVHRRLHTANNKNISNSRTVSCSICSANFDDPGKLRYHRRTEHKGIQKSNVSIRGKSKDKKIMMNQPQLRAIISTNVCG